MSSQNPDFVTPGEYLELERKSEFRNEYLDGRIIPKSGSNQPHKAVRKGARELLRAIYRCLGEELIPALRKEGIRIERVADLPARTSQLPDAS